MEFLRGVFEEKEILAIKDGGKVYPISLFPQLENVKCMIELVETLEGDKLETVRNTVKKGDLPSLSVEEINLLSPIKKPIHDIICVGVNYQAHFEECVAKIDMKEAPNAVYFSKRAVEILGNNAGIPSHKEIDHRLDYEVELAVIIGKTGKNIKREDAEDYIFGYSIFNDVSARGLQKDHGQWFKGKSLDGFCVMGPWIVEKADMPFPLDLEVKCTINDEVRQCARTSTLIRDVGQLIEELSNGTTLEVGDIIITGTPSGVGMGFSPSKFLVEGDIVKCEIEKIGSLINKVV